MRSMKELVESILELEKLSKAIFMASRHLELQIPSILTHEVPRDVRKLHIQIALENIKFMKDMLKDFTNKLTDVESRLRELYIEKS